MANPQKVLGNSDRKMVSFSTASQAFYIGKFGFYSWNFPVGSFTRGQKETLHFSGKASWRSWFLDFTAGIGKNTYRLLHWPMFLGTGKIVCVCTKFVVAYRRSRHLQKKYIMKQTQNHISISIYTYIIYTWNSTYMERHTHKHTSSDKSLRLRVSSTSLHLFKCFFRGTFLLLSFHMASGYDQTMKPRRDEQISSTFCIDLQRHPVWCQEQIS